MSKFKKIVERPLKTLSLKEGEKLSKNPNKPIIHINGEGKQCYLWIGNNNKGDKFCYATVSGQKTLKKFAQTLLKKLETIKKQ